jgi:hypothetical protein
LEYPIGVIFGRSGLQVSHAFGAIAAERVLRRSSVVDVEERVIGVVLLGDSLDRVDESLPDLFHLGVELGILPAGSQPQHHLVILDVLKTKTVAATLSSICLLDLRLRNERDHPVDVILEIKRVVDLIGSIPDLASGLVVVEVSDTGSDLTEKMSARWILSVGKNALPVALGLEFADLVDKIREFGMVAVGHQRNLVWHVQERLQ